jgi:hypothetical protein
MWPVSKLSKYKKNKKKQKKNIWTRELKMQRKKIKDSSNFVVSWEPSNWKENDELFYL